MKRLTFFSLLMLLTACGGQQSTASNTSSVDPVTPEFVFACTAAVPEGAVLRSLRVFVNNDVASISASYFNTADKTFAAEGSVVVQNNISAFAAAWTGASFSAEQVRGRVYSGSYTTDGAATAVRCVRVETSDRTADEFAMTCAPNLADEATSAAPHELYLTYEEGELEMFVNPTSDIEIFDLELASGVRVSDGYVTARWNAHDTTFTAEKFNEHEFAALLYYRGLTTYSFRCWKL